MLFEKSCGALVVRREGDNFYILMIRHKAGGNRSFPKGHVEGNETEYETALREVMAEKNRNHCCSSCTHEGTESN